MEPLLLPPDKAFALIGVRNTKGYELISSGDLEAVKIGRSTRITVASIKAFVEGAQRVKQAA